MSLGHGPQPSSSPAQGQRHQVNRPKDLGEEANDEYYEEHDYDNLQPLDEDQLAEIEEHRLKMARD